MFCTSFVLISRHQLQLLLRKCTLRFASTHASKTSQFQDLRASNMKITSLIRSGRLHDARKLFDELEHRNTVTWNSMLTGYVQRREMANARKLFDEMPHRDVVSWNLLLSGYISCRGRKDMEEARLLFDRMPKRDFISWNTLISGYARNGNMDEALRLFNSMPERNVISWNAIITGFLQNGNLRNAVELFERMPERDGASLSALVSGLIQNGELDEAARMLFEFGKRGDQMEDLVNAYNTLIAGYGQRGRVKEARCLFDQIPFRLSKRGTGDDAQFERNMVSWNSMIMCYVKARDIFSARELFDQMVERDTFSWNTMINGYVHVLDMEEASSLCHRMPNPDMHTWNSMISGYALINNMQLARDFFERMPQKSKVSWNTIIAAYEKNSDYEEATKLFIQMQREGEKPDRHTLSSVLSACFESMDIHLGMQIHQQLTKFVIPDIPLNNSLITMYARCGAIIEARATFNEMELQKNVISWNAMIGAYASHGYAEKALELFELMKKNKTQPTYITFISVLNACAHAGLVEEGRIYFKSMVSEFGIRPRVEHFASLVDVVGRYGQIEEAMALINIMPMEPDKAVWGALLGACRVHNNVDVARVAAEALMRLEPESSAPYVLLYNMYVDVESWDFANEVRKMMEKNSIRKEAGYSRVNLSFDDFHCLELDCRM